MLNRHFAAGHKLIKEVNKDKKGTRMLTITPSPIVWREPSENDQIDPYGIWDVFTIKFPDFMNQDPNTLLTTLATFLSNNQRVPYLAFPPLPSLVPYSLIYWLVKKRKAIEKANLTRELFSDCQIEDTQGNSHTLTGFERTAVGLASPFFSALWKYRGRSSTTSPVKIEHRLDIVLQLIQGIHDPSVFQRVKYEDRIPLAEAAYFFQLNQCRVALELQKVIVDCFDKERKPDLIPVLSFFEQHCLEHEFPKQHNSISKWLTSGTKKSMKWKLRLLAKYHPSLSQLNLSYTPSLPANILPDINKLFLTRLDLSGCKLPPRSFTRLTNARLNELCLNEWRDKKRGKSVVDDALSHLKITSLQIVSLKTSAVTGRGLIHLKTIKKLDLSECLCVDDNTLSCFESFSLLTHLNLSHNRLNGNGLTYLRRVPLKTLMVSHTFIDDQNLAHVKGFLPSLENLDLSHTSIRGTGLSHLKKGSQLKRLDISFNDLHHSIHTCFAQCHKQHFDLPGPYLITGEKKLTQLVLKTLPSIEEVEKFALEAELDDFTTDTRQT